MTDEPTDIEALTESTGDGSTIHGEFIKAEPMTDEPTGTYPHCNHANANGWKCHLHDGHDGDHGHMNPEIVRHIYQLRLSDD